MEGRCTCGEVRYRLDAEPLIVHACHCTWCQRETGGPFAINALIESDAVTLLQGEPIVVDTPSASGIGQRISRCPTCHVALWSNYGKNKADIIRFVRVGTLEEPARVPPSVHIFTSTKLPWVLLSDDAPVFEEYYERDALWSDESKRRRRAAIDRARG